MESENGVLLEEWKQNLEFMRFQQTEYWERFNVFLGIDSALLVFVGILLGFMVDMKTSLSQLEIFFFSLSGVGFIFNLAWLFANFRSHAYYEYWFTHAKNIEKEKLRLLTTCIGLDGYFGKMPRRCFYKTLPITTASQIVPVCFCSVFTVVYSTLFERWYFAVLLDIVVLVLFAALGAMKAGSIHKESSPNT